MMILSIILLLASISIINAFAHSSGRRFFSGKTSTSLNEGNFFQKLLGNLSGKKEDTTPVKKTTATTGKKAVVPAVKKDMTWGGRPDPNPEMYVEEPKPKKIKK